MNAAPAIPTDGIQVQKNTLIYWRGDHMTFPTISGDVQYVSDQHLYVC